METAVRKFEALASALEKIKRGHEYDVEEWFLSGYRHFCFRPDPLLPEEMLHLTLPEIAFIARIREERTRGGPGSERFMEWEALNRDVRASLTPCTIRALQCIPWDIPEVERDEDGFRETNDDNEDNDLGSKL